MGGKTRFCQVNGLVNAGAQFLRNTDRPEKT